MKGKKELELPFATLKKAIAHLNVNQPIRTLDLTAEEKAALTPYPFLTAKKVLYACNVSDADLPHMENDFVKKVRAYAEKEGNEVIPICAKLEEEIAQLPAGDRKEFLNEMGLEMSGLDRLIRASFHMLGLITFLTTGEIETRAWTITRGMNAQESAGKIHTDIQKGFIRAEVVTFPDMVTYKGRVRRVKPVKSARREKNISYKMAM